MTSVRWAYLFMSIVLLATLVGCGVSKSKYDALLTEKVALEEKVDLLTKARDAIKNEYDNLLQAKMDLESTLETAVNEKSALKAEYDKLLDEKISLKAEFDKVVAEKSKTPQAAPSATPKP